MDDEVLVRWFLEHGARPNLGPRTINPKADSASIDSSGICLNVAAQKSSIRIFDMLLNHGAPRENSVALHMAAGAGVSVERIPMMTHLIAFGFDVNGSDEVRGSFCDWNTAALCYQSRFRQKNKVSVGERSRSS